jgi:hypothetical protein
MSVPTHKQAFAFLRPLRGRASVFTVPSRSRNSSVAGFLLGCLAESRTSTMIFDTSSFYGANITTLTQSLPKDFLQQSTLITPPDDLPLEDSMTGALTIKTGAILIDDLNALHYLLSSGKGKSGTHRLFAFIRLLSYEARINDLYVFGTVYMAEGDSAADRATKRSLSAAADLQISTDAHSDHITFRCDEIKGWPNNRFSTPLYFDPST